MAGFLGAATSQFHVSKSLAEGTVGLAGVILTGIVDGDSLAAPGDVSKEVMGETSTSSSSVLVEKESKSLETMPPSAITNPDAATINQAVATNEVEAVVAVDAVESLDAKEETTTPAITEIANEEQISTTTDTSNTLSDTSTPSDTNADTNVDTTSSTPIAKSETNESLEIIATIVEETATVPVTPSAPEPTQFAIPTTSEVETKTVSKSDDEKAIADVLSSLVEQDLIVPGVVIAGVVATASSVLGGGTKEEEKGEWKVDKPVPYGLQNDTPGYGKKPLDSSDEEAVEMAAADTSKEEEDAQDDDASMDLLSNEVTLKSMVEEKEWKDSPKVSLTESLPLVEEKATSPAATSLEDAVAAASNAIGNAVVDSPASTPATTPIAKGAAKSTLPPGVGGTSSYSAASSILKGNAEPRTKQRVGTWGPKSQGFATYGLGGKPKGSLKGETTSSPITPTSAVDTDSDLSSDAIVPPPTIKAAVLSPKKKAKKQYKYTPPTPYGLQEGTPKSTAIPKGKLKITRSVLYPKPDADSLRKSFETIAKGASESASSESKTQPPKSVPDVVSLPKSFKATSKGLGSSQKMDAAGISMANIMKGGRTQKLTNYWTGTPKQKEPLPPGKAPDVVSLPKSFKATSKGIGSVEKMNAAGISMARVMKGETESGLKEKKSFGMKEKKSFGMKEKKSFGLKKKKSFGLKEKKSFGLKKKSFGMKEKKSPPPPKKTTFAAGAGGGMMKDPSMPKSRDVTTMPKSFSKSAMKKQTAVKSISMASVLKGDDFRKSSVVKAPKEEKHSPKSFAKSSYKKSPTTKQKGAEAGGSSGFLSDLTSAIVDTPPTKEEKKSASVFIAGSSESGGAVSVTPKSEQNVSSPPKSFSKMPSKVTTDSISGAGGGAFGIPPKQSFGKAKSSSPKSFAKSSFKGSAVDKGKGASSGGAFGIPPPQQKSFGKASGSPKSYAKTSLKGSTGSIGKGADTSAPINKGYVSDLKAAAFSAKKRKSFGKTASFGKKAVDAPKQQQSTTVSGSSSSSGGGAGGGDFLSNLSQTSATTTPGAKKSPARWSPKSSVPVDKKGAPSTIVQSQSYSPPVVPTEPEMSKSEVVSPGPPAVTTANVDARGLQQQQQQQRWGSSIGEFGASTARDAARGNNIGYPTASSARGGVVPRGTPPVEEASIEPPLEGNAGNIESSGESEEGYPPDARVVSADLQPPQSSSVGVGGGDGNDTGKKSLSVTVTDPRTGKKRTISVSTNNQ